MGNRKRAVFVFASFAALLLIAVILRSRNERPGGQSERVSGDFARDSRPSPTTRPPETSDNPKGVTLRGLISEEGSGLPVPGATVDGTTVAGARFKTKASDSGEYSIRLESAPKEVRASLREGGHDADLEGTAKQTSLPATSDGGDVVVNLRISFLRRFTITGRVHDRSGTPIRDASVDLGPERGGKIKEDVRISGQSGPDGSFKLAGLLPSGRYELHGSKNGFESATTELELAGWFRGIVVNCDLELGSVPVITGTVRSGGQVVKGANIVVAVRSQEDDVSKAVTITGTTDEAGRFSVGVNGRGDVSLAITHPLHPSFNKELGPSGNLPPTTNVDVTLDGLRNGQYFRGQVTDQEGKPVVPKQIYLLKSVNSLDDPEGNVSLPAATNGTFEVVLEPGAKYWIVVYADGFERLVHQDVTTESISKLSFRLEPKRR